MDWKERLGDFAEAIRVALDARQASIHTGGPGIVVSYDSTKMTAVIQPAILAKVRDQFGNYVNVRVPLLQDCPVHFPSGGGFTLTMPVKNGDEVYVSIAERCIDAWWQSGGVQPQAELRMHDLSDGFFFPKVWSQPNKLANVSTTSAQLRSDDGTTFVEVAPGGDINIVGTDKVKITAPNGIIGSLGKPYFSAFASATLSLPNGVFTKVVLDTEVFDSDGDFASGRFTPTVAGTYLFGGNAQFIAQSAGNNQDLLAIFKNGSQAAQSSAVLTVSSLDVIGIPVSALLQMNGTTDFVELFAFSTYPSGMLLGNGASLTYLWGTRIGP